MAFLSKKQLLRASLFWQQGRNGSCKPNRKVKKSTSQDNSHRPPSSRSTRWARNQATRACSHLLDALTCKLAAIRCSIAMFKFRVQMTQGLFIKAKLCNQTWKWAMMADTATIISDNIRASQSNGSCSRSKRQWWQSERSIKGILTWGRRTIQSKKAVLTANHKPFTSMRKITSRYSKSNRCRYITCLRTSLNWQALASTLPLTWTYWPHGDFTITQLLWTVSNSTTVMGLAIIYSDHEPVWAQIYSIPLSKNKGHAMMGSSMTKKTQTTTLKTMTRMKQVGRRLKCSIAWSRCPYSPLSAPITQSSDPAKRSIAPILSLNFHPSCVTRQRKNRLMVTASTPSKNAWLLTRSNETITTIKLKIFTPNSSF